MPVQNQIWLILCTWFYCFLAFTPNRCDASDDDWVEAAKAAPSNCICWIHIEDINTGLSDLLETEIGQACLDSPELKRLSKMLCWIDSNAPDKVPSIDHSLSDLFDSFTFGSATFCATLDKAGLNWRLEFNLAPKGRIANVVRTAIMESGFGSVKVDSIIQPTRLKKRHSEESSEVDNNADKDEPVDGDTEHVGEEPVLRRFVFPKPRVAIGEFVDQMGVSREMFREQDKPDPFFFASLKENRLTLSNNSLLLLGQSGKRSLYESRRFMRVSSQCKFDLTDPSELIFYVNLDRRKQAWLYRSSSDQPAGKTGALSELVSLGGKIGLGSGDNDLLCDGYLALTQPLKGLFATMRDDQLESPTSTYLSRTTGFFLAANLDFKNLRETVDKIPPLTFLTKSSGTFKGQLLAIVPHLGAVLSENEELNCDDLTGRIDFASETVSQKTVIGQRPVACQFEVADGVSHAKTIKQVANAFRMSSFKARERAGIKYVTLTKEAVARLNRHADFRAEQTGFRSPEFDFCLGSFGRNIYLSFYHNHMESMIDHFASEAATVPEKRLVKPWNSIVKFDAPVLFACSLDASFWRNIFPELKSSMQGQGSDRVQTGNEKELSKSTKYEMLWSNSDREPDWNWQIFQEKIGPMAFGLYQRETGMAFRIVQLRSAKAPDQP